MGGSRIVRLPLWAAWVIGIVAVAESAMAPSERYRLLERLQNGRYSGVFQQPVQLENGRYEGAPFAAKGASRPMLTLVENGVFFGDLDGDGREEAAAFLSQNSGGSGTHTYLAAVTADGTDEIPALLLGDRVQIRSFGVRNGQIIVDLVTSGPEDAACCPTAKRRNSYRLDNGRLTESASELLGRLTLADLEGTTWQLTHMRSRQPVPNGIHISARFEDGRISGSAGCNRYFGAVSGAEPWHIKIGQAGVTRRMCPPEIMEQEDQFLAALKEVSAFSFVTARLALSYRAGDTFDTLLFAPRPEYRIVD